MTPHIALYGIRVLSPPPGLTPRVKATHTYTRACSNRANVSVIRGHELDEDRDGLRLGEDIGHIDIAPGDESM